MLEKILNAVEVYCGSFIMAVIALEIFLQIVFRVLGLPLGWTEESARYLMVWATFIACSKAVKDKRHLSVGLLPMLLKNRRHKIASDIIADLFCLLFFTFVVVYGVQVLKTLNLRAQYSPSLRINMIIPYGGMVFGFLLMLIRMAQMLIVDCKSFIFYEKGESSRE
ncbi:hypothetical protein FACS189460_5770 [Deltaproteobacteria bacterium]|nr:hypothetical protein FACS189460_5770 [Deltaproteobacteria bacterium]